MELAIVVVAHRGYNLELYINASMENPPHISAYPPDEDELISSNITSTYYVDRISCMLSYDVREILDSTMTDGASEMDVRSRFMAKVRSI